jgi:hypothetical protein
MMCCQSCMHDPCTCRGSEAERWEQLFAIEPGLLAHEERWTWITWYAFGVGVLAGAVAFALIEHFLGVL